MTSQNSCPHLGTLGDISREDLLQKAKGSCSSCPAVGPNLWACLQVNCSYVGCGESAVDHSTHHAVNMKHALTMNLTTFRTWCYSCETEVFLDQPATSPGNNKSSSPYRRSPSQSQTSQDQRNGGGDAASHVQEDFIDDDADIKPKVDASPTGLTGLQNIGNTCYMNAALQALSNCPPLTNYFLECGGMVGMSKTEKKPGLSKSYLKLMLEMWHKKRPSYLVPVSIAHGIKMVNPMFRGYTQQDSQEFLRCLMDQLHEELKEPITEFEDYTSPTNEDRSPTASTPSIPIRSSDYSSSHSDEEYHSCESGGSSEQNTPEDSSLPNNDLRAIPRSSSDSDIRTLDSREQRVNARNRNRVVSEPSEYVSNLRTRSPRKRVKSCQGSIRGTQSKEESKRRRGSGHDIDADIDESNETTETGSVPDSDSGCSSSSPMRESPPHSRSNSPQGVRSASQPNSPMKTSLKDIQPTFKSAQRKKRNIRHHSIISDVFDGKILSSVQCLTCDRVSCTKETFQDISLPIPSKEDLALLHSAQGPSIKSSCTDAYTASQGWMGYFYDWLKSWFWGPQVTLDDCLSAFFSADDLKGDNMYSCEKCRKLRNGLKFSKVLELPEILCIHLKRFRHEVMYSTKINNYVSFPLEGLDLRPFMAKESQSQVTTYDLVAVICHHGTANGGHYTAYCMNHLNGQWYEFDDMYVTEVMESAVTNAEAYVLFYRKRNEEMERERHKVANLVSTKEPGLMKFYISRQWLHKFTMFAEPGPISNNDFLCRHGGIPPHKSSFLEDLVTTVPEPVWEYLLDKFGGGPVVNHLFVCATCQVEQERLEKRRKIEMETFIKLNKAFQEEDSPPIIYYISMKWFREWEAFVKGKEQDPPGPVDNSSIATGKGLVSGLKPGSDSGQISEETWQFLVSIYGGGPEIIQRQTQALPDDTEQGDQEPEGGGDEEGGGEREEDDQGEKKIQQEL
ncbi:ubiquitin carboxyl-terminal hydrolase 20-like isoform X1 [Branchiostoma floridae]|uniref:Ubiquitin carboxyl-terminal hydrolase n=2 Tax=Branchiostoma floridae TaxID=7739 RepID=A0A9J7LNH3_BRAFL|nr:ubiquitin carboxyl-terminal hydrolase 20-like isoform X1 [Branchiostoma floridae]XP_035684990.1 ubiquitin carboxyl-terminal hydrolase 20-like isoform X1 [Branchiostoma floridae]XP_035684991.1 ubiquitin carboxyl-terminal hydrolase 20-like isoform X1 [Branchiostoma floridae]